MKFLRYFYLTFFSVFLNIHSADKPEAKGAIAGEQKKSSEAKKLTEESFCCGQCKGTKPTQQDRFLVSNYKAYEYMAVYDGHGGEDVVNNVATNLHINIFECPNFPKDIPNAIISGFLKTNNRLQDEFAKRQGTTATAALIYNGKIHIAWVGDSRIVLYSSKNNNYWNSIDHNLNNLSEINRVKKDGGVISPKNRLFNYQKTRSLEPTRGFGDKNYPGVTCHPEIRSFDIAPYNFAILASDGLWNILDNAEAIIYTRENLPKLGVKATTKGLIEYAIEKAKRTKKTHIDNITAIIVNLDAYKN